MDSAWEAIFMLLILKIPLVYLALVIWWAVRPAPASSGGGDEAGVPAPLNPCDWDEWKRRRRPSPWPPRPFKPIAPHARRLVAGAEA